ncbi:hypothetical protein C2E23DRAFT_685186, partial [Lenzites betulinus]
VLDVLDTLDAAGLTVADFLRALSWGNPACVTNTRIKNTRTSFLGSPYLLQLLRTWWKPPRSPRSHKSRPKGARQTLKIFALEAIQEVVQDELGAIDPLLRSSSDRLTKDDLT